MVENRTPEEVSAMIARLEAQPYSFPNEVMLEVLRDDLSEDDVWDKYPDDDEDWEARDYALTAVQWLEGEADDDELLDE